MKDQALEYKSLLNKVELMINNISELGINTEKYKNILKNIVNEVENKTNISKEVDEIGMLLIQDYENGIKKLRKLESHLEEYNVYFKSLNTCNYIDTKIENENTKYIVNDYSNKIIEVLKNINNSSTLHYEEEKKIIEKVYDTAYKIIKLEIITNGNSIVYDYIKKYDTHLYFINDIVLKEINRFNLKDDKYYKIKEKIYEIKSNGLDHSYFDLGLIKLLLCYDDNNDLKNNIYIELNNILKEIEENTKKALEKNKDNEEIRTNIENIKDYAIYLKKDICKKTLSVLLSIFITLGIGTGIYKVTKRLSTDKGYKMITTTYSNKHGLTEEEKFVKKNMIDSYPKTLIKEYGVWQKYVDGTLRRDVISYDVSNYEFENIEDYLKNDLEYYNVEGIVSSETKSQYDATNLYKEEFLEVEQNFIDKSQIIEKYIIGLHIFSAVMIYIIYILMIILIMDERKRSGNYTFFEKLGVIIDNIKKLKSDNEEKNEHLKQLKIDIEELYQIINSNEELIQRFNKLYEENKYLLNNTDELYEKFNELTLNIENNELNKIDTKKLIKRRA